MSKRIYKVTNVATGAITLAEASSQGQAVSMVSSSLFKTEVCGTGELARMIEGGTRVLRMDEKKPDAPVETLPGALGQPPAANQPTTQLNPVAKPAVVSQGGFTAPAGETKPAWLPPAAIASAQ